MVNECLMVVNGWLMGTAGPGGLKVCYIFPSIRKHGISWTLSWIMNPYWLVVWNMFYFPFHIWDVILPIDELIFFKMFIAPPTSIMINHY